MKRHYLALAALIGLSTQASASLLVEDFSSLPLWQTGWLTTHSNLSNYYGVQGGATSYFRGNNPDGLWLDDNDGVTGIDTAVRIMFDTAFGSSLQMFSLDVASHIPGADAVKIDIFDTSFNTIFSSYVTPTEGALSNPGLYQNFTVSSLAGIGGFELRSGSNIEGNIGIDNVMALVADGPVNVPEPSALFLLGAGILGLFAKRRRII